MWGSDWPVVTLASSYDRWHATARALTPVESHAAIFGGTARRFYGG
jgi:L-fuconolactonase